MKTLLGNEEIKVENDVSTEKTNDNDNDDDEHNSKARMYTCPIVPRLTPSASNVHSGIV